MVVSDHELHMHQQLQCTNPIVRLISLCNKIFGDIILTFCPIKLKFPSIVSTFMTNSEARFNWIRQHMKNFPIDPHCKNCPLSATL